MGRTAATQATGADDLESIRADLTARIASLDVRAPYARACDLAPDIAVIRRLAWRGGLHPAVTVAALLDSAIARGEHGPLVHGWLGVLADAVGCERSDAQACDAYAAACSVRFAG